MAKIRNISDHELVMSPAPFVTRVVGPDETVEVADEDIDAFVWRDDGIPGEFDDDGNQKVKKVASDLWVEAPDLSKSTETS